MAGHAKAIMLTQNLQDSVGKLLLYVAKITRQYGDIVMEIFYKATSGLITVLREMLLSFVKSIGMTLGTLMASALLFSGSVILTLKTPYSDVGLDDFFEVIISEVKQSHVIAGIRPKILGSQLEPTKSEQEVENLAEVKSSNETDREVRVVAKNDVRTDGKHFDSRQLPNNSGSTVPATDARSHIQSSQPKLAEMVAASEVDRLSTFGQPSINDDFADMHSRLVSTAAYERKDWRHWIDEDLNCLSTRDEVLKAESVVKAKISRCRVVGGEWHDPYTSNVIVNPGELDIDHMVPLKEAHLSGGASWSLEKKERYANDLKLSSTLIAVSSGANRSKGAQDPAQWMPDNADYHCEYIRAWKEVKDKWGLRMDPKETKKVEEITQKCTGDS